MEQIRAGMVGTSWWEDAMYMSTLAGSKKAVVLNFYGRNEEPDSQLASNWDIPAVYTNWEEMLDKESLDAIVISTPKS